jgi:hypothetical protein
MSIKAKHSTWLLSWCSEGLEAVVNVDEYQSRHLDQERQAMWDTLSAEDPENVKQGTTAGQEFSQLVNRILMRARVNSHRHYEVYAIGMPAGTTEDDIKAMFDGSGAQYIVDLIREKGTRYYSDRATQKARIL